MAIAAAPRPRVKKLWTFEEMSAKLSETNSPTELWDGEISMSPAPTPAHQAIVFNFATLLRDFVTAEQFGFFLSPVD
jgi:Uma2 family endonuclease